MNKSILTKEGLERAIWRAVNDVHTIEAYGTSKQLSKHNEEDMVVMVVSDDCILEEEVPVQNYLKKTEGEAITKSSILQGDIMTIKSNSSLLLPLQSHTSHSHTNYFLVKECLMSQYSIYHSEKLKAKSICIPAKRLITLGG